MRPDLRADRWTDTLRSFVAEPAELRESARQFFNAVRQGSVRLDIGQRYPLADVQRAHRDLESRATTGATVLIP